ncbi:hypothetical protein [Streptomyces fractus]|uniref:hypothetical protein n=1 Tax=Streptomyces fractus TaxID=641806 RepID=UPI003CF88ABE
MRLSATSAVKRSIDNFKRDIEYIRRHAPESKASDALLFLQTFAERKPIDELVRESRKLDERDRLTVLASAALSRSPADAAAVATALVVEDDKHDADEHGAHGQQAEQPVIDSLVQAIARQRLVTDVAAFVEACRKAQSTLLSDRTLASFADADSGRTAFDKALLYFVLRDQGLRAEAHTLLTVCLQEVAKQARRGTAAKAADAQDRGRGATAGAGDTRRSSGLKGIHDLVGAFHFLSPSEAILERYVDLALSDVPDELPSMSWLVVSLMDGCEASESGNMLSRHIADHWSGEHVAQACSALRQAQSEHFAELRRLAARRRTRGRLVDLVTNWWRKDDLRDGLPALMDDVVSTGSEGGPRALDQLDWLVGELHQHLDAGPECIRQLWLAAARQVAGRTGPDLTGILERINSLKGRFSGFKGRGDLRTAARVMGEQLAEQVLADGADISLFTDCLGALEDHQSDAVRAAFADLVNPARSVPEAHLGDVVADIAVRLRETPLHKKGWEALHQLLKSDMRVESADVVTAARRLHGADVPEDARRDLFKGTVGMWGDTTRREAACNALREAGLTAEASWAQGLSWF